MALPKLEERTLYPPIVNYLKTIGIKAVGETTVVGEHPDILFKIDSLSFVIEVKIGKPEIGLKAVAQASDYARKLKTQNIVILIYPERYRNQSVLVENMEDILPKLALEEEINAIVLTDYWTESLIIKPAKLFERLKQLVLIKEVKIDFKTVVKLIETYVRDLNSITYQIETEELAAEVVSKLDLFSSIGEIKDKETAKKQVINLASYLLFNQVLFYHIYKRKAQNGSLPELEEIEKLQDIQNYFNAITNIDYQSIYRVNILGHIPTKKLVLDTLNEVIKAIKLLRAEHITHDLAGRFFHDLIPFEVRKVLAAFYTHPIAAEILAGLTIDSWDETIIDPACGSGTLLVAAYKRKEELYQKLYGYTNPKKMHKQFIENDLTGIDIMPFAAHISTINLTTQNIDQETNIVRIATKDSLELAQSLTTIDFKEKGTKISPYTETIQRTLFGASGQTVKKGGAISPEGGGAEFYLKPVDVVIMNPPFSDRDKMPEEMRTQLKEYTTLTNLCGNAINLWGYFLALAHFLLKEGGKIGGVIPVNIARGETTEKIRYFLFSNYRVRFMIKPVGDFAFSEGSAFKDVLFIAEKGKPKSNDLTTLIFLKKSIRSMNSDEAKKVVNKIKGAKIKSDEIFEDEYFSLKVVKQSELNEKINNLMLFIGGSTFENMHILRRFIETTLKQGKNKLTNLELNMMREGITSPKGLGQMTYITRPLDESRTKMSFLILNKESDERLLAKVKNTDIFIEIPKKVVMPALRTLTGIKTIDATRKYDYITKDNYKDFGKILMLSKSKGKFNWQIINKKIERLGGSRLVIPDKLRLSSVNTRIISAYSDDPLILSNMFFSYTDLTKEKCTILSLSLNSVLTLSQFITLKSETLGGYIRLSANDWNLTVQLAYNNLNEKEKNVLLKLFNDLANVEFPSLIEQLENRFASRVKLDEIILKIIGLSDKEINEWLPKVYDALVRELKATKEIEA